MKLPVSARATLLTLLLAIQNRDETKARVEEAQNAIDEQELRHQELLDEVDSLCREQEELQPGSFADCMAQFGS